MIRALLVAAAITAATIGVASTASADCYINADGTCVPEPTTTSSPPSGATYQCVDGAYSFSKHLQGACSHHGGVDHAL